VGSTVLVGSGLPGGALLGLFFVTGSVLTQITRRSGLASSESPKSGRNARQVCANGLWAAVGAGLVPWRPAAGWSMLTGALAARAVRHLGHRDRRSIGPATQNDHDRGRGTAGTSGGITLRGTLGGLVGAAVLAASGVAVWVPLGPATAGVLGGIVGMVGDSLLGATVQARFHCDACNQDTERRRHKCGSPRDMSPGGNGWTTMG